MEMVADRVLAARRRAGRTPTPRAGSCGAPPGSPGLGGATLDNEENYLIKKLFTALGRHPDREPGPYLTLRHRSRSGNLARARRRHRRPARARPRRQHRDHGLEHGRGPPGRVPVGGGGQGARRPGDPHRPALHPHQRAGRHVRADPGGQRHRVPRRRDQLHPAEERGLPRVRRRVHERVVPGSTSPTATPRTSTGCSAASTRRPPPTTTAAGSTRPPARRPSRRTRRAADEEAGRTRPAPGGPPLSGRQRRGRRGTRPCSTRAASSRSSSGTSRATPRSSSRRSAAPRASSSCAVCEAWTAASGRERTGTLIYSVGWTQHSVGAQYIRAGSIVQLLLGNIGRPGGGILALRGHASIQGCTDIPTLFNLLPGYLPMPSPGHRRTSPATSRSIRSRKQKGFWYNADAYMVSLLKEYWGEHATAGQRLLLRLPARASTATTASTGSRMDMVDGKVPGYFLFGQNPAVGLSNGRLARLAMAQLDWLVVRDLVMIESATFWKDAPEIETGEIDPSDVPTEVFFFPAASHVEKEGTFTQTERMLQWREKAVEPAGDQTLRAVVRLPPGPDHPGAAGRLHRPARPADPRAVLGLRQEHGHEHELWGEPERRGRAAPDQRLPPATRGELVGDYRELRADGSTSSGCWIYSGVFKGGVNLSAPPRRRAGRQVGLGVAAGPARPLQPGLGRPAGTPVERAQEARLVGRGRRALGGRRHPRLPGRPAARVRAAAGRGRPGRAARRRRVRAAGRRQGLAVRAQRGGRRPAADALRARRVAGAQPAARAAGQPGPPALPRAPANPANPAGDTEVFPFVLTASRLTEHSPRAG